MTDWVALWSQLVEASRCRHGGLEGSSSIENDPWRTRARDFQNRVKHKWTRPDLIREFIAARVYNDQTVLDIGAGTGSWAILLARRARKVTAIEPSPAMREVLLEALTAEAVTNVDVVSGSWPGVEIEPHDISLCSHAMYGVADLPEFVRRMIEATRKTCYLLLRVPMHDSIMARAATRVWGQSHDSANFIVAYNVLLQMGIHANVLMEYTPWGAWESDTPEAALFEIKRRLQLEDRSSEHDQYLMSLLQPHLDFQDGRYRWPRGVHSGLIYWDV